MPVMLIHGDNALEIGEAVRAVRERFNAADVITLEGETVALPVLSEATRTAGLFDPERLVIVHGLEERFKGRGKESVEVEEIRALLADIAPTTTLVLMSPGMTSDHQLVDAVRSVGGTVREHRTPRRRDLPRWIVARGKTHRVRVDPDAAELLAELVGGNAVMLDSELEKLATYAGDEGRIVPGMVDELVGAVTQDSIFALVDAVAAGNKAEAFRLLHAQIEQASGGPIEVALYLIRMLARQVRILLRIRLGQEAGRSTSQITSELKLPRYYADRYFRQARRLSGERLRAAFEQLAALEYALKSGKADAATGLDLLVVELCS
jgi:DNA polymerase-3 subunit delta